MLIERTIEMDDSDVQVSLFTDGVLSETKFYDNGGTEQAYETLVFRYADDGVTLTEQVQTLDTGDIWTTRYRDNGVRHVFILEDGDGSSPWETRADIYLEDGITMDYRVYVYADGSETYEWF